LDYPERLQKLLLTPQREMSVELVVQMDNGEIEVFNAYRVQHNNRCPLKLVNLKLNLLQWVGYRRTRVAFLPSALELLRRVWKEKLIAMLARKALAPCAGGCGRSRGPYKGGLRYHPQV
jgi:hypothetical protein